MPQSFEMSEVEFDEEAEDANCFRLHCYYIDFDGFAWKPVVKTFCVPAFEGTKGIDSLPVFPLRYHEISTDIKSELIARGKKFTKCITDRHLQYTGWGLVHDPRGGHLRDFIEGSLRDIKPGYIDGPCIIDFEETLNTLPDWSPAFRPPDFHTGRWAALIDNFEVMRWSDYSRKEFKSQEVDMVQSLNSIDMLQRRKAIEADSFLASVKRRRFGRNADQTGPVAPLRDEDLALLPKRLYGYALRERFFLAINVELVSPIPVQDNVFEQLKIPRTTKDLLRSVVIEHFEKKRLERTMDAGKSDLMTQDSIGGKGKGLTLLLHGVPGVGKTATAEAVALEHRRPLFTLTPGDLGTDSYDLTRDLRHYFRLASRWDCILLLDEADTFLSQRSKYDIERNALISGKKWPKVIRKQTNRPCLGFIVFLQILEYYNGILFLTTNRVGHLDEAFQSRIHLTLYYPSLDQIQTEQIFKVNLQKLRDTDAIRRKCNGMPALQIDEEKILDFARRPFVHATRSSRHQLFAQWNGRQIRNAFYLASSLAYRSMAEEFQSSSDQGESDSELSPSSVVLDNKQFQKVADTMQAFNEYFKETRGFSDADLAFLAGDRADFWEDMTSRRPNQAQQRPGRYERPYSSWNDWDRPGPRDPGESPYGQRVSSQQINPYAVRPEMQAESSSQRQDIPTRGRDRSFEDMSDTSWRRQQFGSREQAPTTPRGLDDFRSDPGYQYYDRRGEPQGRPGEPRGGPYSYRETEY